MNARILLRRFWPALLFLAGLSAALILLRPWQGGGVLSLAQLRAHQAALLAAVAAHPVLAALAYATAYAVMIALSLPGGGLLTLAGGLLFGTAAGAALAVLSATAGATLLFLGVRHVSGGFAPARVRPFLDRIRSGIERDGFSYVLALRLMPVFPFWLVNLAPPLLGMRLLPFVAATLIGIVPATTVIAGIGAGLGTILAAGGRPDLSVLLSAPILLPLAGLTVLSLLPVVWRRWKRADA